MTDDQEQPEGTAAQVYRPSTAPSMWYEEERDELSLVGVANLLLRHRWKIVLPSVLLACAVVGWTVLQKPTYTADASIVPQTDGGGGASLSRLSGVASQFGIEIPTGQAAQSPRFYADLLTSRRLLEEAVTTIYRRDTIGSRSAADETASAAPRSPSDSGNQTTTRAMTLVELYGIEAPSRPVAIDLAAERLEQAISVSTSDETGVVELSVTMPWPVISKQVTDRLVELVNRFNNRVRQSQASAQAEFVAERLDEARRELRAAEDSLETFLQRNVSWQQSPELRFRHDRLQRQINLKQQVYTALASRYEEARINEVRQTPVVTTITEPQVPSRSDPTRLPLKAALALALGGILGAVWAVGAEMAVEAREEKPEDYRRFLSLKQDAVEDVRRAGHRIRRLLAIGSESDKED